LNFIKESAKDFGLKRLKPLPVSGAFHTPLMASAQVEMQEAIAKAEMKRPIIPVYSNVTSHRYKNVSDIRRLLLKQLCAPVRWEQTMQVLFARDTSTEFPLTYEVGPGKQLGSILKNVNNRAFTSYENVSV
jgi:[acyl-carrier-protein] S-malonyltransferase